MVHRLRPADPGLGLPGIVGAVSLLVAMYALQMLPVSYAGVALILLGMMLATIWVFSNPMEMRGTILFD